MHQRSGLVIVFFLLLACAPEPPSRANAGASDPASATPAIAWRAVSAPDASMVPDAPCEGEEPYRYDDPADSSVRAEQRQLAGVAGAAREGAVLRIPLRPRGSLAFRTCDDERSFRLLGRGPGGRGVLLAVYFFEDYRATWWVDDSSGTWSELPADGTFSPDSAHVVATISDDYWQAEGAGAVEFHALGARAASRIARAELGAGMEWRNPRWVDDSIVIFDRFQVSPGNPAVSLGRGRARLSGTGWTLDTLPPARR